MGEEHCRDYTLRDLRNDILVFEPRQIMPISAGSTQIDIHFLLHLDSPHGLRPTLGIDSIVAKECIAHSFDRRW